MRTMNEYDRVMSLIGNNGGTFSNDDEVRKYFRVRNIVYMFGECRLSQCDLDQLCEAVIEGKEIEYADLFDAVDGEDEEQEP